jgi:hypothetical protein
MFELFHVALSVAVGAGSGRGLTVYCVETVHFLTRRRIIGSLRPHP